MYAAGRPLAGTKHFPDDLTIQLPFTREEGQLQVSFINNHSNIHPGLTGTRKGGNLCDAGHSQGTGNRFEGTKAYAWPFRRGFGPMYLLAPHCHGSNGK